MRFRRAYFATLGSGVVQPVLDILERWASREPNASALVSIGARGQLVQGQTAAELALESGQLRTKALRPAGNNPQRSFAFFKRPRLNCAHYRR